MFQSTHVKSDERGIALISTLFFVFIFLSLGSLIVLRTFHENTTVAVEKESAKSFYAALGGANAALDGLDTLINTYLLNTISSANPSGVISFAQSNVASGDGIGWLLYAVRNNNTPVLTQNGAQAEYSQTAALGDYTYQYNIIMTEKSDPVTVSPNVWDFPYNYRIESVGTSGTTTQKLLINGDFTVRLQRDNFARYALFTNTQTMPSGTNVWFTNKTSFAGPIHTNTRFNIALNPSGIFDGVAEQHEQQARFYNQGWSILLDAAANSPYDVPTFNAGFNRGVDAVSLSSPVQQQDMIDQAQGGQTFSSNGIYLPNNGSSVTGGIYIRGDSTINMDVNASNNARYTITQGSTTTIMTVDRSAQQTSMEVVGSGTVNTYSGLPDGLDDVGTLVFADGNITSLGGTVQANTEMTIASDRDIVITNHILYENYTPAVGNPGDVNYAPPSAVGTANLLGLVTWNGNVRIGTSAPNNVNVHGTILAQNGIFQVDNYNDRGVGPRGTATLLGGVISNNYGAFGLFSGATGQQLSGYGRNFVYDQRMQTGSAPPYFPTLNTFIAFTNDMTDRTIWHGGDNQ